MRLIEEGEETLHLGSMTELRRREEEQVLLEIDRSIKRLWKALQRTENKEVVSLLTKSVESLRHSQCILRNQIDPYLKRYGLAAIDKQQKKANLGK